MMRHFKYFLLLTYGLGVYCELFTAMADFEETLLEERVVLDTVLNYIKRREEKLDILRQFSDDCKNEAKRLSSDMGLFWHPLNIFHLLRRLTDKWQHARSIMIDKTDAEEAIANITSHRSQDGIHFPTEEDAVGAALGLFRLQDTYALDTQAIADGLIEGIKYWPRLTAYQCLELGIIAHELRDPDYYHALLWLQEAQDRLQSEIEPTTTEAEILDYLSYAMYMQENVEWAAYLAQRLKTLDPTRPNVDANLAYYMSELRERRVDSRKLIKSNLPIVRSERKIREQGSEEFLLYESLCRGEKNKKPSPDLNCYYKSNRQFIRLAPLKVELIHRKPKLFIFRDIVSPSESLLMRQLGAPKLARAMISNANGDLEAASYRISKSGWLGDNEHGLVATISERVEDMTDLTTRTAENLQIANYGIGGHYEAHYDFALKHEKNAFKQHGAGNRVATVLFYLSEPTAGGATVFPVLKLSLFPTKNDAVMWYNLAKSGDGDTTLLHAACPVLSGVKWVANKWIHEHGQEFIRPCSLNELEYE